MASRPSRHLLRCRTMSGVGDRPAVTAAAETTALAHKRHGESWATAAQYGPSVGPNFLLCLPHCKVPFGVVLSLGWAL